MHLSSESNKKWTGLCNQNIGKVIGPDVFLAVCFLSLLIWVNKNLGEIGEYIW